LASDTRAGIWASGRARREQRRFLRRKWRLFTGALLIWFALVCAAAVFMPGDLLRGIVIGAGVVPGPTAIWILVMQLAGTAATMMGDTADRDEPGTTPRHIRKGTVDPDRDRECRVCAREVAQDGTKPTNTRFLTISVDVIAYQQISDPGAPPAGISPEDFFVVDATGKRYDVWNGNSLHALPRPSDRLQPTKLPTPRDRVIGRIAFDVPGGPLKLGYTTPEGVLSPAVSKPVLGYWNLPFAS
jgi:hypothetical protein